MMDFQTGRKRAQKPKARSVVEEYDLEERWEHMAVRLDNCIVIFGGVCGVGDSPFNLKIQPLNVIYVYNFDSAQWVRHLIRRNKAVPPPTAGACAVTVKNKILMHGGITSLVLGKFEEFSQALWELSKTEQGCFQ